MSRIFKYNDITILHNDSYIVNKQDLFNKYSQNTSKDDNRLITEAVQAVNREQAKELLLKKQSKAAKILENAQKEAESIKNKAYDIGYSTGEAKGYEEGYKEGYKKAVKEMDRQVAKELARIDALRKGIFEKRDTMLTQIREDLLQLALNTAQKVISFELSHSDKYIEFLINHLKNIQGQESTKLYVSQEDFEKVADKREYIISSVKGLNDIEIIADKYLVEGSCIIDSGIGAIDCSIDTQLNQIEMAFRAAMDHDED
ncbi:MAG: hypothetical protein GX974_03875 [Clostridiales bacterium]|nr:hypothetical protein [Clostridiales bacterium]